MVVLSNLKLVASKRNQSTSPVLQRRNKLCGKLAEQLQIVEAQKTGQIYAPTKLRTVTNNATGETTTVQVPKRVKEWFWTAENGKLNLSVKYGSKTLALNKKGANAIELEKWSGLFEQIFLVYKWKTCGFTLPLGPLAAAR